MLNLYLCGEKTGYVQQTSQGILARCPMESGYIYRLELVGEKAEILGVMMPRDGYFVFEKQGKFDLDKWRYGEILRSRPGETVALPLPFALSHGKPVTDWDFIKDALLKECLCLQPDARTAIYKDRRYIYFPFRTEQENPMSAFFFCLTVFSVKDDLYAALCIDENNMPVPLF